MHGWEGRTRADFQNQTFLNTDCLYTYNEEYIYNGEFCTLNKAKLPNLKRIFSNSEIHLKERHGRKMRKQCFKLILPRRGSEGSSENRQNENKSQKMGIKGSNEFKLRKLFRDREGYTGSPDLVVVRK